MSGAAYEALQTGAEKTAIVVRKVETLATRLANCDDEWTHKGNLLGANRQRLPPGTTLP